MEKRTHPAIDCASDPFNFVLSHGGCIDNSGKDLRPKYYCVREMFPRLGENLFDQFK